jgi:hypothetical protein
MSASFDARSLADELVERAVTLPKHLHARPAGEVAQAAARHRPVTIELVAGARRANAGSILPFLDSARSRELRFWSKWRDPTPRQPPMRSARSSRRQRTKARCGQVRAPTLRSGALAPAVVGRMRYTGG